LGLTAVTKRGIFVPRADYDHFTSHDGVPIAYRVSGHGRPVVLIHGYTVPSTVNFATHYRFAEGGSLKVSAGPTVESALLDGGFQVVLYDLRGHGHSARPHDPACYSMDAHVGDVQALVAHLDLDHAAVVGYSFGAMIAGRLLSLPWVSAAVLSATGSFHVEGEDPDIEEGWPDLARCFSEGCWDDYPELKWLRMTAQLDADADFLALAAVARGARGIPKETLLAVTVPVLVLNGGADDGAGDEFDLTPFVPGARRAVAGEHDHAGAPGDPLFQGELVRFLGTAY
jgi:pimeloyl-ACP methyl ester carboxylesterase